MDNPFVEIIVHTVSAVKFYLVILGMLLWAYTCAFYMLYAPGAPVTPCQLLESGMYLLCQNCEINHRACVVYQAMPLHLHLLHGYVCKASFRGASVPSSPLSNMQCTANMNINIILTQNQSQVPNIDAWPCSFLFWEGRAIYRYMIKYLHVGHGLRRTNCAVSFRT